MSVDESVKGIVAEQLGIGVDEINNESSFIAVSYTHLTLPTTPYV